MGDYAKALAAGTALDPARKHAIAEKLHSYTGLPTDYIERANLRVNGGEFEHTLQIDRGLTTGRLDSRFSGPTMDSLEPGGRVRSTICCNFIGLRRSLQRLCTQAAQVRPGPDLPVVCRRHLPGLEVRAQAARRAVSRFPGFPNVIPDLSAAMKYNPRMHVMLNSGYYDLATPFYTADYEMRHLPIPAQPDQEHRDALLRIRPHGVRASAVAEGIARQRRGVYRQDRQRRGQVGSRVPTTTSSI